MLSENQNFVIKLFENYPERGEKFYEVIEKFKKFEYDYPQLWVNQSYKIPLFTLETSKGKYQKKILNYRGIDPKKIKKHLSNPTFFWGIMKRQSNLSDGEWKYVQKELKHQTSRDTIHPFVIPIDLGEKVTWLGLERKFKMYNKKGRTKKVKTTRKIKASINKDLVQNYSVQEHVTVRPNYKWLEEKNEKLLKENIKLKEKIKQLRNQQ